MAPLNEDWRPTAPRDALALRARTYQQIRDFFRRAGVLEVETPLLSHFTVTDIHLDSFKVEDFPYYLQSSPEYAMKRLLAAGSGPIFQLGKAFRRGEQGKRHNPEFTLLEWYRPGFDEQQLITEVAELMMLLLGERPVKRCSYRDAFLLYTGIDPHQVSVEELRVKVGELVEYEGAGDDTDTLLELLMSHVVEPQLGRGVYSFIYDYPASQCALARIKEDESGTPVAKRFELYIEGVELANGYLELTDAGEQRRRFEQDRKIRQAGGREQPEISPHLLAALTQGLPDCAGVALGIDRLLMLAAGVDSLDKVLCFPFNRA